MRNNLNYWCVVVINCLFGNILCFSDPYGQEFFTKLLNEGQIIQIQKQRNSTECKINEGSTCYFLMNKDKQIHLKNGLEILRKEIYNSQTNLKRDNSSNSENELIKVIITFSNYPINLQKNQLSLFEFEYGQIGRLLVNTTNTKFVIDENLTKALVGSWSSKKIKDFNKTIQAYYGHNLNTNYFLQFRPKMNITSLIIRSYEDPRKYFEEGRNITITGYQAGQLVFKYREKAEKLKDWTLINMTKMVVIDQLEFSPNVQILNINAKINEEENLRAVWNLVINKIKIHNELEFLYLPQQHNFQLKIHNFIGYLFGIITYNNNTMPDTQLTWKNPYASYFAIMDMFGVNIIHRTSQLINDHIIQLQNAEDEIRIRLRKNLDNYGIKSRESLVKFQRVMKEVEDHLTRTRAAQQKAHANMKKAIEEEKKNQQYGPKTQEQVNIEENILQQLKIAGL